MIPGFMGFFPVYQKKRQQNRSSPEIIAGSCLPQHGLAEQRDGQKDEECAEGINRWGYPVLIASPMSIQKPDHIGKADGIA